MEKKFDPALILIIPLLGIIGGGYLSLPITSISKGREPWTSLALVAGLALAIALVGGLLMGSSHSSILIAAAIGILVYTVMASVGGFRQHIEPFFAAHMLAFMALLILTPMQNKEAEQGGDGDAEEAV
ncbi:hypothetical protein HZ994_09295 [Akkermansiaceae bacterium]|nr:hypothetical protein HZ994_09295 [Akkermansiaceae bacterium]